MTYGYPQYQVQIEQTAPSPTDTAAQADELQSKLLAELDRVRAKCIEDVPWLHEAVAGALSRGTLDEAALEAAIAEARASDWDSRRLALALGLAPDETNALIAGFVAIDLGFPPQAGAKVVASKPMVDEIKTLLDSYRKIKREKERAQKDRDRATQALVSELTSVTTASRHVGSGVEKDESRFWWLASPWVLVAAIAVALFGISVPMFSGVSDVYVTGTVVRSIEHRTQESLYYTTTVAYSPKPTGRADQATVYTITGNTVEHAVGSKLRVYYDPDDPGRASFNSAAQAREWRTFLVALGALAAVVWIAARYRYA